MTIAPADGVMIPGDCEKCGSTNIEVEMKSPTRGVISCSNCGHQESFSAARMETFEELLGL